MSCRTRDGGMSGRRELYVRKRLVTLIQLDALVDQGGQIGILTLILLCLADVTTTISVDEWICQKERKLRENRDDLEEDGATYLWFLRARQARVPSFSYTSMPMPMPMPVHTINSSMVHRPLSSKQLGSQMIQPSKPRRTLQVSTGPAHAGTAVSGCYTMPTKEGASLLQRSLLAFAFQPKRDPHHRLTSTSPAHQTPT
ncbi:hypothetical protein BR93DRAFT_493120 [Coniochaeta sp. PMI_546]|nr:hypothetical protein BR93DRAFT_493120 [Coniochaeta sp. PMI_546]